MMKGGNDLEKRIKEVAILNSINYFLSASNWNIICCGFWMMMEATTILESGKKNLKLLGKLQQQNQLVLYLCDNSNPKR